MTVTVTRRQPSAKAGWAILLGFSSLIVPAVIYAAVTSQLARNNEPAVLGALAEQWRAEPMIKSVRYDDRSFDVVLRDRAAINVAAFAAKFCPPFDRLPTYTGAARVLRADGGVVTVCLTLRPEYRQ
jgi:hypothetical protein